MTTIDRFQYLADYPLIFNDLSHGDNAIVIRGDEPLEAPEGSTVVLEPGDQLWVRREDDDAEPLVHAWLLPIDENGDPIVVDEQPETADLTVAPKKRQTKAQKAKAEKADAERAAAEAEHVAAVDAGNHPSPDAPTGAHPEATSEATSDTTETD